MRVNKKTILSVAGIFIFLHATAQNDTTDVPDCTTGFFERSDSVRTPSKLVLVTKQVKTMTLSSFLKSQDYMFTQNGLVDLDTDGKKELVINGFTGGAHCCDEFYIFKNIATNKYQYVAKTFAGNICITDNNEFVYDFYEMFGYFFTCYACAYEDTTDAAPTELHNIVLKYNKGKLSVVPGNTKLKSQINDNLAKLGEQPYQKLEGDIDQDNGLRKEFALNLAVFYYSFGRNVIETKKLFDKYYKYPDAKKVWLEWNKNLKALNQNNGF